MITALTHIFSKRYRTSAILAVIATSIFATTMVTAQLPSDNLLPITANQVQNTWIAENKSNYYYTFIANPGELAISLNTQSDRGSGTVTAIVMDQNRRELGSITTLLQSHNSQKQNNRRFRIKKREQIIIQVAVDNYYPQKGAFLGKFQLQLQGNIEPPQVEQISASKSIENTWNTPNKSNYYYTFIANPGNLHVNLNTQSNRGSGTVVVTVMDKDRREIGSITTLLQGSGSQKHNGNNFLIKQRQQLIIEIAVDNYYPQKGEFLGKYRVELQGNIEALRQVDL